MKFIVLKCDDKNVRPKDLVKTAKRYENTLNGMSPEIDDPLYIFEKKQYIVIPLFYGLTLQKIEDDLDGFDIYIKELTEIKNNLGTIESDNDVIKNCSTCKNNVEYPPPHTCDICQSLDQEEDYEMWEGKEE